MVAFAENKILKGGACRTTGDTTILTADFSTPPAGTQPLVNNLYQGMTLDAVTGLYYERNRDYSPSLGTWVSQDPLQYINGANTYQFVMSNPRDGAIRIYDPETNTFGSYNSNGTTRTFCKPWEGVDYWNRQRGVAPTIIGGQ